MASRTSRATRSARATELALRRQVASSVLATADIQSLLLPLLDFRSFVALRRVSRDVCAAMQHVCEGLIDILRRAAKLYVSPKFADGLRLVAEHKPQLIWLLQTPALAIVAPERYDELIASSYHLLQARPLARTLAHALALALTLTPSLGPTLTLTLTVALTSPPHPAAGAPLAAPEALRLNLAAPRRRRARADEGAAGVAAHVAAPGREARHVYRIEARAALAAPGESKPTL